MPNYSARFLSQRQASSAAMHVQGVPALPPLLQMRGREKNWMYMVQQDLDQGSLKLGMSPESSRLLHVQIQINSM